MKLPTKIVIPACPIKKHSHYRALCLSLFGGALCAHFAAPEIVVYLEFIAGTAAVYDPFV